MVARLQVVKCYRNKEFSDSFLTVSIHSHFEAFLQSAGLALVSSCNIDRARIAFFALISEISSDAAFEKSPASVARQHAVMLS